MDKRKNARPGYGRTWLNSADLTRMLGWPGGAGNAAFEDAIHQRVRPILRQLGCAKTGPTQYDWYIVTKPIAEKVAEILGRPLNWPA